MSMCGICWFDGRSLTDEIDDLRQRVKEAEARSFVDRERFISALITMRKALVLNGSRLTDDAINAYEELKLSSAETEVTNNERSYDDPASGDAGDTPRTDALIEQWMRSPTPVPPEFIAMCKTLERESYSKLETMAMLAENWTRTERLLAMARKELANIQQRLFVLDPPRCPICDLTLIDGEWCANHGAINERLNPNDYR